MIVWHNQAVQGASSENFRTVPAEINSITLQTYQIVCGRIKVEKN